MTDEQTDQSKNRAAVEEARREIESLTYTLAHDLRAPLRSIDGFSRALVEDCADKLDPDGRRYLQYILQATQRMSGLIEGVLSLARLSGAELRRAPLDLSEMARRILARMPEAGSSRQVEVVIPDGIRAEGDEHLVSAALTALLLNAWKFTRRREAARIELGMASGTPLVYHVRDNGAGFDMRYAGKLFAPFHRLHSAEEFEGVGVGLAAAHRIIRRHGGRIWAEGRVDEGATFYFTLEAPVGS